METETLFRPPRRVGLALHLAAFVLVVVIGAWSTWRAANAVLGPSFLFYLLPVLVAVVLAPWVAYRAYALSTATYLLSRDGVRLRWGLRLEQIPMNQILWVRSQREMPRSVPSPALFWPGALLGLRRAPGLGAIEYFVAQPGDMILLATTRKVYAISPGDPTSFLQTFRRYMELGSLNPFGAESVYPSFLLARLWRAPWARTLLLAGLVLNLGLIALVSFVIPARQSVWLGFAVSGQPVPPVRLYLLPLLSGFFFLVDTLLGLAFFRQGEIQSGRPGLRPAAFSREEEGVTDSSLPARLVAVLRRDLELLPGTFLAHLLWGAGVVVAALFYLAIGVILRTGG